MDFDLTGIDVLAARLALYLFVALVIGIAFGWYSALPPENE